GRRHSTPSFFSFTDPSLTLFYSLSLHDALPICCRPARLVRLEECAPRSRQLSDAIAGPAHRLHGDRARGRRAHRALYHRAARQRLEARIRGPRRPGRYAGAGVMSASAVLLLMTVLFLTFGYMGVPV